jgi:hypothetical protein
MGDVNRFFFSWSLHGCVVSIELDVKSSGDLG